MSFHSPPRVKQPDLPLTLDWTRSDSGRRGTHVVARAGDAAPTPTDTKVLAMLASASHPTGCWESATTGLPTPYSAKCFGGDGHRRNRLRELFIITEEMRASKCAIA